MFEEVLPSIRVSGSYELQALKDEIMLKEKEHAEEISASTKHKSLQKTKSTKHESLHKQSMYKL